MKRKITWLMMLSLSVIFLGALYLRIQYHNGIELTQLSPQWKAQMCGYFIKTRDNKIIVVDGGNILERANLDQYIQKNGGKVDAWFITHPHNDHIGAMLELINGNNIQVDHIYASLNTDEWYKENEPARYGTIEKLKQVLQETEATVEELELNQIINIDNVKIEILGVKNPEITEKQAVNNQSVVIKMHVNNKTILFLGDTGKESSEKLLKSENKNKLKSYAVQVSHHGQNGATKELYEVIHPTICFWPTTDWLWDNNEDGKGYNTGSWTTLETRQWMEELGVKQNYLAKDGDITVRIW